MSRAADTANKSIKSIVMANLPSMAGRNQLSEFSKPYEQIEGYLKSVFVVYKNPIDVENFSVKPNPGKDFFVVGEWLAVKDFSDFADRVALVPRSYTLYEGHSLEDARQAIVSTNAKAVMSTRFPGDDVAIFETWI